MDSQQGSVKKTHSAVLGGLLAFIDVAIATGADSDIRLSEVRERIAEAAEAANSGDDQPRYNPIWIRCFKTGLGRGDGMKASLWAEHGLLGGATWHGEISQPGVERAYVGGGGAVDIESAKEYALKWAISHMHPNAK